MGVERSGRRGIVTLRKNLMAGWDKAYRLGKHATGRERCESRWPKMTARPSSSLAERMARCWKARAVVVEVGRVLHGEGGRETRGRSVGGRVSEA